MYMYLTHLPNYITKAAHEQNGTHEFSGHKYHLPSLVYSPFAFNLWSKSMSGLSAFDELLSPGNWHISPVTFCTLQGIIKIYILG
jgi:hypothetical protein